MENGLGNAPFFSVLVPTFNHARYIAAALDSLVAQTDPDWEALVVDHGSTDDSASIVASRAQQDPRIRLFSQANRGTSEALTTGLRESRGEWVCWLSSDGLFDSRKLEIHRQWIRRNPGRHFFHSHFRELDDTTGDVVDPPLWGPIPDEKWQVVRMLGSAFIHGNSICVARRALRDAGGFDARFRNGQDYDMWLRLLARYPAMFIPERTCVTRIHADQGTREYARDGFYDSAWAAIDFLNGHRFQDLFPIVDLHEESAATEAIARTLRVATNPHAFLYSIGAHPLLLLRVLEWIDLNAHGARNRRLRHLVLRECDGLVSRSHDAALAFYAKALRAALRGSGGVFRYDPIGARAIASQQLGALRSTGDSEAAELERYLERTGDVIEPSVDRAHRKPNREVVFVCQRGQRLPAAEAAGGALHATLEVARYAQRSGYRVLVIALSDYAFGFVEGLPFIGACDEKALARVLRSLRSIYGVVAVSRADVLTSVAAQHSLVYHHGPHVPLGEVPIHALNSARVPVVCVSEYSRSQLTGFGIAPHLLKVIRNGYDQTTFPGAEAVARVSHSLVMAGTIIDYKGVDVALEALRLIRERFSDATLSVFGSNLAWPVIPATFESRGLIDEQRRLAWEAVETAFPGVRYGGEVSRRELAVAFAAHEFLVMPSRIGETFGIVSLEAQACGCLPVLPKEGAFAETMLPGETGFLYEPNTAVGLADRVIGLWESQSPTEDQRAHTQAWVSEEFSWKRAGSEVLTLLDAAPSGVGLRLPLKQKVFACEIAFGRLARRNSDRARRVAAAVEGQPIADWPRLVRGLWDARRLRRAQQLQNKSSLEGVLWRGKRR